MRQILQDYARSRLALKRNAPGDRVQMTRIETPTNGDPIDVLALDEALSELAAADEQGARVVELRYFGGLSIDEAARVLGASSRTVDRAWRRSRAWIRSRMADADG